MDSRQYFALLSFEVFQCLTHWIPVMLNSSAKFILLKLFKSNMKVLFICNQNQNRSKTAEELFKCRYETKSAGLYNDNPVTRKQIAWADAIVVMEESQRTEIAKRFPKEYMQKQIISLDIPDIYHYNQPKLVELLDSRINELF